MKNARVFNIFLLVLGLSFTSASCAPGIRLNTLGGQVPEPAGTYTVIYYGCNYLNDPETVAFLEKEGGKYPFEPYAPDFTYRVKKGIPANEATRMAMEFVDCNHSFSHAQTRSILSPEGETIGYEVRPIYLFFAFGFDDILDVGYRLKEGKVVITVDLIPSMERRLQDDRISAGEE